MTGPAYVQPVDLDHLPSQAELGPLFVPTCMAHDRPWSGPSTRDAALAGANARLHNTDCHGRDQGGLFDLDTQETR